MRHIGQNQEHGLQESSSVHLPSAFLRTGATLACSIAAVAAICKLHQGSHLLLSCQCEPLRQLLVLLLLGAQLVVGF